MKNDESVVDNDQQNLGALTSGRAFGAPVAGSVRTFSFIVDNSATVAGMNRLFEGESVKDTVKGELVESIVKEVLRDCPFWAPEIRLLKLADYLNANPGLYEALKALPDEDREACGVDEIVVRKRDEVVNEDTVTNNG
jgi:hypothetical protein